MPTIPAKVPRRGFSTAVADGIISEFGVVQQCAWRREGWLRRSWFALLARERGMYTEDRVSNVQCLALREPIRRWSYIPLRPVLQRSCYNPPPASRFGPLVDFKTIAFTSHPSFVETW